MNLLEFCNKVKNNNTAEHTLNNYKLKVEYTTINEEHWCCYEITLTDTEYNNVIFRGHVNTYDVALLFKLIETCYSLIK